MKMILLIAYIVVRELAIDPCVGDVPLVLTNASTGIIESPNYPRHYPSEAKCQWLIEVSEESIIKLNFVTFDTENE